MNARTASDYITIATQRAVRAAEVWARTGRITGVPEGVNTTVPNAALAQEAPTAGVQAKAKSGGVRNTNDPRAIQEQLGEGHPLASGVRSRMESVFGMSFSCPYAYGLECCNDFKSGQRARFTVGNHVAFGTGEYQPGNIIGDALIAHELAHTIQQQKQVNLVKKMEEGNHSYDALENDADQTAVSVMSSLWGGRKGITGIAGLRSGLRLQRCDGCGSGSSGPTAVPATGSGSGPTTAPLPRRKRICDSAPPLSVDRIDIIDSAAGAINGYPAIMGNSDLNAPGPFNDATTGEVKNMHQIHFHLDNGSSASLTPSRTAQATFTRNGTAANYPP